MINGARLVGRTCALGVQALHSLFAPTKPELRAGTPRLNSCNVFTPPAPEITLKWEKGSSGSRQRTRYKNVGHFCTKWV